MSKVKVSYRSENGGHKSLALSRREIVALVKKFAKEADGKRDNLNQRGLVDVGMGSPYKNFRTQLHVSREDSYFPNPQVRVTVGVIGIGRDGEDRIFFTKSLKIDEKDWIYSGLRGNEAKSQVASLLSALPQGSFQFIEHIKADL